MKNALDSCIAGGQHQGMLNKAPQLKKRHDSKTAGNIENRCSCLGVVVLPMPIYVVLPKLQVKKCYDGKRVLLLVAVCACGLGDSHTSLQDCTYFLCVVFVFGLYNGAPYPTDRIIAARPTLSSPAAAALAAARLPSHLSPAYKKHRRFACSLPGGRAIRGAPGQSPELATHPAPPPARPRPTHAPSSFRACVRALPVCVATHGRSLNLLTA